MYRCLIPYIIHMELNIIIIKNNHEISADCSLHIFLLLTNLFFNFIKLTLQIFLFNEFIKLSSTVNASHFFILCYQTFQKLLQPKSGKAKNCSMSRYHILWWKVKYPINQMYYFIFVGRKKIWTIFFRILNSIVKMVKFKFMLVKIIMLQNVLHSLF